MGLRGGQAPCAGRLCEGVNGADRRLQSGFGGGEIDEWMPARPPSHKELRWFIGSAVRLDVD